MTSARRLITCLGEGLMDMLPIVEEGATVGFRMAPAGSILNVAVGLARLDEPTAFAGRLADDYFGRRIAEYVRAENVGAQFLTVAPGQSTLAFVMPPDTSVGATEPSFSFFGDHAADTLLTLDDIPAALYEETATLHLGSISLLRGETPQTALTIAERLKGHALLSLDPNIRPNLVTNEMEYRARLDHFFALADVLKLSLADLAWLEPGSERADPFAVAASFLARGPALVALTLGAHGAALVTAGGGSVHLPAPQISLVDTVGAGDAFAAGLLSALADRGVTSRAALAALPPSALAGALRWATTISALTCARAGANPPTRREALAWLAQNGAPTSPTMTEE